MKKVPMNKIMNENSSDLLYSILESVPELRFVTKLDDALKARGLTQGKLATLTGLRPTTISEIVNSSCFCSYYFTHPFQYFSYFLFNCSAVFLNHLLGYA